MTDVMKDNAAKILCEIIDDNSPIGWQKYRGVVSCIVANNELIELLNKLNGRENDTTKN